MRGRLSVEQCSVLTQYLKGRVVHDLGAGDLTLAGGLLELGARHIVAVDADYRWHKPPVSIQVTLVGAYFDAYVATEPEIDVAFVSWPEQYAIQGLRSLVQRAKTVIYLGSNFDGTVCGSFDLWTHLRLRQVLATEPDRKNTLIVYGELGPRRPLLPEEYSALRCEMDDIRQFGSLDGRELWFP